MTVIPLTVSRFLTSSSSLFFGVSSIIGIFPLMLNGIIKNSLFLPFLSGLMLVLIFPKFDLELLGWVAIVPLLISISRTDDRRKSFLSGFTTGFIYFLGTTYWVVNSIYYYGHLPFYLSILILLGMVLVLSLYIALFSFLYHLISKTIALPSSILVPLLWTSLELARTYLLSGFPWSSLGYSQYRILPAIQIADITGVYGMSFLIAMVNGAIADIFIFWKGKRTFVFSGTVFTIIILIVSLAYGVSKLKGPGTESSREMKVSIIQGNIDQDKKWEPRFQQEVFETYLRLTREVLKDSPDIIIWPETATPFYFDRDKGYRDELINFVKENNINLLFGTQRVKSFVKGKYTITNSAYLLPPSGVVSGIYDKIHLVPFGEYVPLKKVLFFIDKLVEGIGDFSTGNAYTLFEMPEGKFGTVICYEIIFPGLVRKFVREGAEFMITITNDAWFGKTSAPYQHFSMAVLRAVENRVFIARAANTGISGFIDSDGRILKASDIFQEGAYTWDIRLSDKKTFYTRHGDIFAYLCLSLTLFIISLSLIKICGERI